MKTLKSPLSRAFVLILKACIGAFVVVLISLSSRSGLYYVAGLIPLFPAFALMSHVITFKDGADIAVREAALFGLAALIPYAAYLGIVLLSLGKVHIGVSLLLGVAGWVATASVLIYFWR